MHFSSLTAALVLASVSLVAAAAPKVGSSEISYTFSARFDPSPAGVEEKRSTGDFQCCSIFGCNIPACCETGTLTGEDPNMRSDYCYFDAQTASSGSGNCASGGPGATADYTGVCCAGTLQATGFAGAFPYMTMAPANCYVA